MSGFDPDAVIDAMAPYLGLTVLPAYRAGVAQNLTAAHRIAAPLLSFVMDDEAEPAPVFIP